MDRRDPDRSPPILKTAEPDDAARVTALLRACYPVLWRDAYTPEILDAVLPLFCEANPVLLASGTYFVVSEGRRGRALGAGGWFGKQGGGDTADIPGEGYVRHFAVHPDAQRRGIGRMIMDATLASAKENGVHTLHCTASLTAGAYYEAFGFVETGRIALPIAGVDLPVIAMRWTA